MFCADRASSTASSGQSEASVFSEDRTASTSFSTSCERLEAQDAVDLLLGKLIRCVGDPVPKHVLQKLWSLPLQAQLAALQAIVEGVWSSSKDEEMKANVFSKLEEELAKLQWEVVVRPTVEKPSQAQQENAVNRARRAVAERMRGQAGYEGGPSIDFSIGDASALANDDFNEATPLEGMQGGNEFGNIDFPDANSGFFVNYMYGEISSGEAWEEDSTRLLSVPAQPWWPQSGENEMMEAWSNANQPDSDMIDAWYELYGNLEDCQDFSPHLFDFDSEAGSMTYQDRMWNFPEVLKNCSGKRHWRQLKEKNFRTQFASSEKDITTLMIRNVPNTANTRILMEALDSLGFQNTYDFVYLPMDNGTLRSIGYAFVNFIKTEVAKSCMEKFRDSYVLCEMCGKGKYSKSAWVAPAHLQGLRENLEHYKSTAVHFDVIEAGETIPSFFRPVIIKGLPDSLADEVINQIGQERQLSIKPDNHTSWSACSGFEALAYASDVTAIADIGDFEFDNASFQPPHRTPSRTPSPSPVRYDTGRSLPQLPVKHTFIHYESKEELMIADSCSEGVKQPSRSSSDPCILLHGEGPQTKCPQVRCSEEYSSLSIDSQNSKEHQEGSDAYADDSRIYQYGVGKKSTDEHKQDGWDRWHSRWGSRRGYVGNKARWLPKDRKP